MGGRSSHGQGPGEGEGWLEPSLGTWLGLEERGQGHPLERPPTTDLGLTSGRTLGPPPPQPAQCGVAMPCGCPRGQDGACCCGGWSHGPGIWSLRPGRPQLSSLENRAGKANRAPGQAFLEEAGGGAQPDSS